MRDRYVKLHAIAAEMTTSNAHAVRLTNMALGLSVLQLRGLLRSRDGWAMEGSALLAAVNKHWIHSIASVSAGRSDWSRLAQCAGHLAPEVTKWRHLHDWIRVSQEVSSNPKANGAYATPRSLAVALARLTVHSRNALRDFTSVVDPSCGGGALLVAVLELGSENRRVDERRRAAARLFGVELDPVPHELACVLITIASHSHASTIKQVAQRLRCANALTMDWSSLHGGRFDAVIMNPPWESLRHLVTDELLTAERESTERRLTRQEALEDGLPPLFSAQGRGDRNLYKAFMELAPHLLRDGGRLGALVPSAFASDLGGAQLRRLYKSHLALDRWTSFENLKKHFPIDSRYKFGVLTATRSATGTSVLRVRGFATDVADLSRPHARITADDLRIMGGHIASIPDLTSQAEVDALRCMLTHGESFFGASALQVIRYRRETDMTFGYRDGMFWRLEDVLKHGGTLASPGVYRTNAGDLRVPLLEGRMVGPFDPWQKSWIAGSGRTAQWSLNADRPLAECAPQFVVAPRAGVLWRVAICDVTSATNTRTVLATIVPQSWVCGSTAPVLEFKSLDHALAATAILNSLIFDWLARHIVSGLHLNKFYLAMLSWPRLSKADVQSLSAIAREMFRRNPRVEDVLTLPGHQHKYNDRKDRIGALPLAELAANAEAIVARGYGLDVAEIGIMLADDPSYRRGFWRFYRSAPWARQVVSRLAELVAVDQSFTSRYHSQYPLDGQADQGIGAAFDSATD